MSYYDDFEAPYELYERWTKGMKKFKPMDTDKLLKEPAVQGLKQGLLNAIEIIPRLERQNTHLMTVLLAAEKLFDESEEYDFADGMGKGASQQYWDELSNAIDAARRET